MRDFHNIMICLALFNSIFLFAWTEPVNISNTEMKSQTPSIAVDRDSHIHVAWTDFQTHPDEILGEILYRYFDGDTWSSIINISNDVTASGPPRIATDTTGYPHILWEDWGTAGQRAKIYYSFFDGNSFTSTFCLSDSLHESYPFARLGDIICDSMNNIHVIWSVEIAGTFNVYYTMCIAENWTTPINVSNSQGDSWEARIAIDSKNHLHAVWREEPPSGQWDSIAVFYSKYNGISWSAPVNASRLIGESQSPKVAVDLWGHPHVVWHEAAYTIYNLYYSFFNDSAWSIPYSIDSLSGEAGYRPDIILDSQGNAHIVWSGGTELYYSSYDGTSWSIPYNISDLSVNSLFPDITTDYSSICLYSIWVEAVESNRFEIYYSKNLLTGIEEGSREYFTEKKQSSNFPNPFEYESNVFFALSEDAYVTLQIFNLTGQMLANFDLGYIEMGAHVFSISNNLLMKGDDAYTGIYFYCLKTGKEVIARGKMILIK